VVTKASKEGYITLQYHGSYRAKLRQCKYGLDRKKVLLDRCLLERTNFLEKFRRRKVSEQNVEQGHAVTGGTLTLLSKFGVMALWWNDKKNLILRICNKIVV
jgi:hypothetical protein